MRWKVMLFTGLKGHMQWLILLKQTWPCWTWFEKMMTEVVFNGIAFGHPQLGLRKLSYAPLYLTSIWQLNWRFFSITPGCFYSHVCSRQWMQGKSNKYHLLFCWNLPNSPVFYGTVKEKSGYFIFLSHHRYHLYVSEPNAAFYL